MSLVATFPLNGVFIGVVPASFLAIVYVLWRWEHTPHRSDLPAEGFRSAMAAALRYARHAPRCLFTETGRAMARRRAQTEVRS